MTEDAFKTGFNWLAAMWSHRTPDDETTAQLMAVYFMACGDLSDASWLAACQAALTRCRHFPVPVELRELADDWAEAAARERVEKLDRARLIASEQHGRRLLESGAVTPEQAAERATAIDGFAGAFRPAPSDDAPTPVEGGSWWQAPRRLGRGRR